jgi:hypothetical protein
VEVTKKHEEKAVAEKAVIDRFDEELQAEDKLADEHKANAKSFANDLKMKVSPILHSRLNGNRVPFAFDFASPHIMFASRPHSIRVDFASQYTFPLAFYIHVFLSVVGTSCTSFPTPNLFSSPLSVHFPLIMHHLYRPQQKINPH